MKTYAEFYQYGIDWENTGIKPIVPILGSDLYFCYDRPKQAIKDGLEIAKQLNFEVKEIQ